MFINSNTKNPIFDTDTVLSGFTFRELIDTANANGEEITVTLKNMLNEAVTNAKESVAQNEFMLEAIRRYEKSDCEWIMTDDLQYCKQVGPLKFKLIQAVEVDDKCIICKPETIDLEDYLEVNGGSYNYNPSIEHLIYAYYESIEQFESSYNSFDRLQVLAEMIYEVESELSDVGNLTYEEAEKYLKKYIRQED